MSTGARAPYAPVVRTVDIAGRALVLRRAAIGEILALRHAVLRPGLPRAEAEFAGDDAPTTRHFGAFDGADALCCLTVVRADRAGEPGWQLRGMATRDDLRGRGVGRALLAWAEAALAAEGIHDLWCNARVEAVGFYERLGWRVVSEPFDIPGVGPHRVMTRAIGGR